MRRETKDRDLYRRIRGCAVKHRYPTIREAEANLGRQHVYFCSQCKGYHRTSKPLTAAMQRLMQTKRAKENERSLVASRRFVMA